MTSGEAKAYEAAFIDWLACAAGGAHEPAAQRARAAADGVEGRVQVAATAGHVLDYDDTFLPGIAHLSACTAPVALVLGAGTGCDVASMMDAYSAGFEAAGAFARSGHPAFYDHGLHPTAIAGGVGAAVVASRLLGSGEDAERRAIRLALLGCGGLRAAFGSDAKSLQVGFAATSGVRAARLAAAGATASARIEDHFADAYGATVTASRRPAVQDNWIKAYPCCLQTHGSIEAAVALTEQGIKAGDPITATVHPISRQAAAYDDVSDGLQAKFSIPYTIAFTLLHGPPQVSHFAEVDEEARTAAKAVRVVTDPGLLESEAVLTGPSSTTARVVAATGSPANPMTAAALSRKVHSLADARLDGILADGSLSASVVYEWAGLA